MLTDTLLVLLYVVLIIFVIALIVLCIKLIGTLNKYKLEIKRIRFVHSKIERNQCKNCSERSGGIGGRSGKSR